MAAQSTGHADAASIPPADSPLASMREAWSDAIVVYCGSSAGKQPEYMEAARQLGTALARRGKPLVYGGGTNGLMGSVASATISAGGRVHGIIPAALQRVERRHVTNAPDLVDLIENPTSVDQATSDDRSVVTVVDTMHQRKHAMAAHGAAFIALPGGFGTLEELAEAITWTQLGICYKPTIVLNVGGFYSHLEAFIDGAVASGFIPAANRRYVVFVTAQEGQDWGDAALDAIETWQREPADGIQYAKW